MMRYAIRKLECNFWMDVLEFHDERQLKSGDVNEVIQSRIESWELRVFIPSVFCVVQKLTDGRERRIGMDVAVGRDGKIIENAT